MSRGAIRRDRSDERSHTHTHEELPGRAPSCCYVAVGMPEVRPALNFKDGGGQK